MPLSTRYGFADAPTSAIKGDSSLGWTTLASTIAAGAASGTFSVVSSAGFPSALQFDIDVGLRDATTGLWSSMDTLHITVVSGTTWTFTRTDTTFAHAIGDSVSHVTTALGLMHNPGARTDAGDFQYLNASGRMARLAAPSDGDYALRWTSGVPSWSATVAPTFSGSIAATQVAVGTGTDVIGGSADLTWNGGLTINGSSDPEGWVYAKTINAVLYSTSTDRNDYNHSSFAVVANPTGDITLPIPAAYNFELELNGSHAYRGGTAVSGEVDVNGTAFSSAGDGAFIGQYGIANWFSAGTFTGTGSATGLMGLRGSAQIYAGVVPIIRGVHGWTGIYGGSVTQVAASFVAEPSGTGVPVTAGAVNAGLYVADWTGEGLNTYALWYNGVGAGAGVWRVNQFGVMAYYNPTFAVYTPGTTAFERIKVEWIGDVATIGTEAGATGGVSRVLNLVGSDVQANGVSIATQTYVNSQGFVTASSATAFSNKTGNISQWTNDSGYTTPGAVVTYVASLNYTTLAAVAGVGYATATSSTAFSNKTGNISQWTNDSAYLTSVTTISGNAGTATALQTARTINGTSFNGTADITVTAAAGTLTGSTLAAGVTASSLTSVGTIATGVWSATAIAANKGGTGQTVYVVGDLLQASTTTALSTLAAVATGNVLIAGGVGTVSAWGKVTTSHFSSAAVSQWTNDASYTTLAAVAGVGYLTSVTAHNFLSATHGDTLADTVVRGDLLYGNSTPKWARLAKPSVLSGLSHDGTDVSWVTATGTGPPARGTSPTFTTPILGVASATSLATSAASPFLLTNGQLVTIALTSQTVNPATLTIPNFASVSDTFSFLTLAQTFTNKRITKRVVTASDATSITPNSDSADVTYQANTQALGTLTINIDGGTPTNGQAWLLKIKSTNVQTFAWNGLFVGGSVALPTATAGGSTIDYFAFIYDTVNTKWHFTGTAAGF